MMLHNINYDDLSFSFSRKLLRTIDYLKIEIEGIKGISDTCRNPTATCNGKVKSFDLKRSEMKRVEGRHVELRLTRNKGGRVRRSFSQRISKTT